MLTHIMPQTVTLPVFGSANTADQAAQQQQASGNNAEWSAENSGDGIDFDILAEYLLDDNPNIANGMTDFNFG